MKYDEDLKHALRLADAADPITMKYYRRADLLVTTKPDLTPVTEGDLAVERELSDIVEKEFHEGYLGEEGARRSSGDRTWIVDPIDGTKNFVRHMPIWGTLIALREGDQLVAAAVSAPAMGRRWWASKGAGAWTKEADGTVRQLHVSGVRDLANAFILTGSLVEWDKTPTGLDGILGLMRSTYRHRAIGDFANYLFVAEGAADAFTDPGQKLWDLAAPSLIITEAGGSFWTDATAATPPEAPRLVVGSNGLLEAKVLKVLNLQ